MKKYLMVMFIGLLFCQCNSPHRISSGQWYVGNKSIKKKQVMRALYVYPIIWILLGMFFMYHLVEDGKNTNGKIQQASVMPTVEMAKDYEYSNFGIIIIDSCEYVYGKNAVGLAITHKGNCRFCIERNKK